MTALTRTDATVMLQHLFSASGWPFATSHVAEALPHMAHEVRSDHILRTIDNLQIAHDAVHCRENDITTEECPCLVFPAEGGVFLALTRRQTTLVTLQPGAATPVEYEPRPSRCKVIKIAPCTDQTAQPTFASVSDAVSLLRPMMPWLLIASLLSNLVGLAAPLLIMAIYDRVIPAGSVDLLVSLALGVVVLLAADFGFRYARTLALAHVGRAAEDRLAVALFRKLMSLPLQNLNTTGVDQHLSRFRQFEGMRDVFTGQVMSTLLDLPFALMFLAVLLYIAPAVGLMTLGVAAVFIAFAIFSVPVQQRLDDSAAMSAMSNRTAYVDAVVHQRTIAGLGLQEQWRDRCTPLAQAAEAAALRARRFQSVTQIAAQAIIGLATTGAIVLSAHLALSGSMSFGALIAVIALVSKVLSPIHALYMNIPQILAFRTSRAQADRLLALPEELTMGQSVAHSKPLSGHITFSGVTHRPEPAAAPLLNQVSLTVQSGEVVVIMSNQTASRTAVLDLIDGLFAPIAGTIEHDDIDLRQIARDTLRRAISYATGSHQLFYGTIAQNFRLAAPTLSDDQIWTALDAVGIRESIAALPDGIETRLRDTPTDDLSTHLLSALTIARSLARPSQIYLFAEPTTGLNTDHRAAFKSWIKGQKGTSTICLATSDRSLLALADRFIFLDEGRVTVNDTGDQGRKKMQAMLKNLDGSK